MIAAIELTGLLFVIGVVLLIHSLTQKEKYSHVSFTQSFSVTPLGFVVKKNMMPMVLHYQFGFYLESELEASPQVFWRGDLRNSNFNGDAWQQMPVKIYVGYSEGVFETTVTIKYMTPERLELSKEQADWFHRCAEIEISDIASHFYRIAEEVEGECEDEDDEDDSENWLEDNEIEAAYETLGLEYGDSWEQVKKTYRTLCMKYHPDTFASHDVPSHIEELAVERFKEITNAYQVLKAYYEE